jgi:hypothetical protein
MVFVESFVRAARPGFGSFVGCSDSEPQASSYLLATSSCFPFAASCYLAADVDKHFPDDQNIRKAVAIHWKDYNRIRVFRLTIRLLPVYYYYYRFRVLHHLARD